MVAFDVGAHVGELALLFSRFVGQRGQVHVFEACRVNFKRLTGVCEFARRSNIVLNRLALADTEGTVKLHVYDNEHLSWSTLADRPLEKYGINVRPVGTEEVPATTVDAYCEKARILRIDLLKIDVEGAEHQVLQGARHMLEEKRILCCVFEFGGTTFDMGNSPEQIESYLKEFGYGIENVVSGDAVFPGRASAETARFSMHVAMPKA